MAIREIVKYPDPILREEAEQVDAFGWDPSTPKSFVTLFPEEIKDMQDTLLHEPNGAALAANQVGIKKQVFVIKPSLAKGNNVPSVIINPTIVRQGNTMSTEPEGCLSFPNVRVNVTRPRKIEVKCLDIDGKEHHLKLSGFISRCFQHEMDHLNGVLFIDHEGK
jgi:peptide deformylase